MGCAGIAVINSNPIMAGQPQPRLSVEEYLEMERTSEVRHEYYDGEIFAMVGASLNHNRILTNLVVLLHPQVRKRRCEICVNDMRVHVPATGLYTYPDLVVICGKPELADEQGETLLNPTVIFEVLSESTEAYDRGQKFEHYRSLDSLMEYLLVAQDKAKIEHFVRQKDGWLLTEAKGLDSVVSLPSIDCELRLAEVYELVEVE